MVKKLIKSITCFCLILCCAFSFVACKNKKPGNSSNEGDNNGNQQIQVTTSKILKYAYQKFEEDSNNTKGEDEEYFACNLNGTYVYDEYNNYVSKLMLMLNALSSTENLTENKWLQGRELNVSQNELANKVEKFYILNQKNNNIYTVSIYVLFTLKGIDFEQYNKSYDVCNFTIEYNETTKKVKVDAMCEKSINHYDPILKYDKDNSTAKYFFVSYSSGEELTATAFSRNQNYIENINLIPIIFDSYDCLWFMFGTNNAITIDKNSVGSNYFEDIFEKMEFCESVVEFINNAEVNEDSIHQRISIDIYSFVNAVK